MYVHTYVNIPAYTWRTVYSESSATTIGAFRRRRSTTFGLPFLWGGRHMIVAIETARQRQRQRDA